ncbi:MAG: DUF1043 family protein [Gammaproteobacteria bacterium]
MPVLSGLSLVITAVVLFGLGILTGYLFASTRARLEGGGRTPAELKRDLDDYQERVDDHFVTTNELLGRLTAQYREVYAHMANGARELCRNNEARIDDHLALAAPAAERAAAEDGDATDSAALGAAALAAGTGGTLADAGGADSADQDEAGADSAEAPETFATADGENDADDAVAGSASTVAAPAHDAPAGSADSDAAMRAEDVATDAQPAATAEQVVAHDVATADTDSRDATDDNDDEAAARAVAAAPAERAA